MGKKRNKYEYMSYKKLYEKLKEAGWSCFKGFSIMTLALLMNWVNAEVADHLIEDLPYNQHYAYTLAYRRNDPAFEDFHHNYLDYIDEQFENGEISRIQYLSKKKGFENNSVEVFADYLKTLDDERVQSIIEKYNNKQQDYVNISTNELAISAVATVGTLVGDVLMIKGNFEKLDIQKELLRRKKEMLGEREVND